MANEFDDRFATSPSGDNGGDDAGLALDLASVLEDFAAYEWINETDYIDYDDTDYSVVFLSQQVWFKASCAVVYAIIALLSLVGNALFCVAIWRCQKLHSVTNLLMTNLGIANLIMLFFHPTFFIGSYIIQADWSLGTFLCKTCSSATYMTVTASFWFMAIVAIDRWLAIFARQHRLTKAAAAVMAVAAWLLSFLIATPYLHFYKVGNPLDTAEDADFGLNATAMESIERLFNFTEAQLPQRCFNSCMEKSCRHPLLLVTIAVQFILPLLVMVPTYGHLAVHLARRPDVVGQASAERARRARRRKLRTLLTLLAIVISLIVCWTPLNALAVVMSFGWLPARDPLALLIPANIAVTVSVCLTPLLYMLNDSFRDELKRLVRCLQPSGGHAQTTTAVLSTSEPNRPPQMLASPPPKADDAARVPSRRQQRSSLLTIGKGMSLQSPPRRANRYRSKSAAPLPPATFV